MAGGGGGGMPEIRRTRLVGDVVAPETELGEEVIALVRVHKAPRGSGREGCEGGGGGGDSDSNVGAHGRACGPRAEGVVGGGRDARGGAERRHVVLAAELGRGVRRAACCVLRAEGGGSGGGTAV